MKCPKCGSENPSSVTVCDCGQILSDGGVDLKTSLAEQAQAIREEVKETKPVDLAVKVDIEEVQSAGLAMGSSPMLPEGSGQKWEVEGFGVLEEPVILQGLREGWLTLDDKIRKGGQEWMRIKVRLRPKFRFGVLIDPEATYGRRYSKYGMGIGVVLGTLVLFWREGRGALLTLGVSGVSGWELGYWIGKRLGRYKAKHNPLPSTRQPPPSWLKSNPA